MTILNNIVQLTPILKEAFPMDSSIAISDLNQFIAYFPGKDINLGIKIGQSLHEGEPIYRAIYENETILAEIPEEIFGFECVGKAIPIKDNDEIVGAIGIAVRNSNEKELKRISRQVEEALKEASTTLEQTSNSSNTLASLGEELLTQSNNNREKIQGTTNLLKFIESISSQTKILGINAAIIAAQTGGEHGKAFGVVSKEIQKLATDTANSLENISNFLLEIQDGSKKINEYSDQLSSIATIQSESNQNITDFIRNIENMVTELKKHADSL